MSDESEFRKTTLYKESGNIGQLLQVLHNDTLEDVDGKLQRVLDEIHRNFELKNKKLQNGLVNNRSLSKDSEFPKELPRKEFTLRESLLTTYLETVNGRSLYNCILAFFGLIYLYIAIFYYFNVQRFKNDIALVAWTFGKFHIVTATWLAINLSIVFFLYPFFRFWATNRTFVKKKGMFDSVFCIFFILFEAALFSVSGSVVTVYDLPPVSSFVVAIEQTRLSMKSYAFVRENISRVLKYKPHQDGDKKESVSHPCPPVGKLVYFLFAPTLVYKDDYPRTSHIRWRFVAWNIMQTPSGVLGDYLAFICFAITIFNRAGIEPIPFMNFLGILAASVFAGGVIMFTAFFSTIHSWQNIFAEMLRFGDRMFYDDWWNCTSYAKFYRSWNMLVHDWLYSYIYRDMYVVLRRNKTGAMLAVFMISAVVHEYILVLSFKFVFPLLFTLFSTFGVILVFITRKRTSSFWNVFLWFSLFQGYGLLTVFYSLEWYARINCPRIIDSWTDYIVPRSFYCNIISF